MRIGVYPGTFDPITLGHMDIIKRGMRLVDKLVIGVTTNPSKSPMFSDEERLEMVRRETAELGDGVEVVGFNMLLMKFAEAAQWQYRNGIPDGGCLAAADRLAPGQGNRHVRRRDSQVRHPAGGR